MTYQLKFLKSFDGRSYAVYLLGSPYSDKLDTAYTDPQKSGVDLDSWMQEELLKSDVFIECGVLGPKKRINWTETDLISNLLRLYYVNNCEYTNEHYNMLIDAGKGDDLFAILDKEYVYDNRLFGFTTVDLRAGDGIDYLFLDGGGWRISRTGMNLDGRYVKLLGTNFTEKTDSDYRGIVIYDDLEYVCFRDPEGRVHAVSFDSFFDANVGDLITGLPIANNANTNKLDWMSIGSAKGSGVLKYDNGVYGKEYFKTADQDTITSVLESLGIDSALVKDIVRTCEDQAEAMFNNYWSLTSWKDEKSRKTYTGAQAGYQKAKRQYRAPGQAVNEYIKSKYLFINNKWAPSPSLMSQRQVIIDDAAGYIRMLMEKGQYVSSHIVRPGATTYAVDIAPSSIPANLQRAFENELELFKASGRIENFLYPRQNGGESAYHVVFRLDASLVP